MNYNSFIRKNLLRKQAIVNNTPYLLSATERFREIDFCCEHNQDIHCISGVPNHGKFPQEGISGFRGLTGTTD